MANTKRKKETTLPAAADSSPTALAATDEQQAKAAVDLIATLDRSLSVALPEQIEELWAYVTRLENESAINMAQRGLAYLLLKGRLGHGQFEGGLEERGIHPRSARNAMSVARMLMELPAPKRQTFSVLSGSKLIELAKIPAETLEDMEEKGKLDDIDAMSVRELKEHLRRERHAREKTEMQLHAHQELQAKKPAVTTSAWPPLVTEIRMESTALMEQAGLCLDDMEQLLATLERQGVDLDPTTFNVAATTYYHNLRAIYAKALRLMGIVQQQYGDEVVMDDTELPFMSDEEVQRIQFTRELLLGEHRAKKIAREMERSAEPQKRGRGRPSNKDKRK